MSDNIYEPVIGLEVHLQLNTQTKMFCGCGTVFGEAPNTQACPVCLGFPGALPVINKAAVGLALKVALALNCKVSGLIKFDRKNYFYPDLPKNYQISQFDMPLAYEGCLSVEGEPTPHVIRIRRIHLEEDAGKLIHDGKTNKSLVDFNRSGMPLLEIVTEPDIFSSAQAHEYLTMLKSILEYLEVSDCDMEKGSLRCDANISLRKKGDKGLGVKTELKNMNSFKAVKSALEYEIERQSDLLKGNEKITQQTRLWDENKQITAAMRSKEEAHDYRYFPEPDLVPFAIEKDIIDTVRKALPELPHKLAQRLVKDFSLSPYDAGVLTQDKRTAAYFQECLKIYNKPKAISNWITTEILSIMNEKKTDNVNDINVNPKHLAELLMLIDSATISGKIAKDVLIEISCTGKGPAAIVKEKGLLQIGDPEKIKDVVSEVIRENPKPVCDYKNGVEKSFAYLVGQVMAKTKGKARPDLVNKILRELLR